MSLTLSVAKQEREERTSKATGSADTINHILRPSLSNLTRTKPKILAHDMTAKTPNSQEIKHNVWRKAYMLVSNAVGHGSGEGNQIMARP